MRFLVADPVQFGVGSRPIQLAKVVDGDRQSAVADALGAVGQDLHPQHRMARRQFGCRRRAAARRSTPAPSNSTYRCAATPPSCCSSVAAHPHRMLDRRQRERRVGVVPVRGVAPASRAPACRRTGACSATRSVHAGTVGLAASIGETDVDALPAPAPRQRHHPDRVQAGGDQVGLRVQLFGVDAEQFGHLGADRSGTRQPPTTRGSSRISKGCPNFVEATLYSVQPRHSYPEGSISTDEHGIPAAAHAT